MFAILVNDNLHGFWGNKPGDIFIENTITNLKLDSASVKLLHYNLDSVPEFFEFVGTDLLIKQKVVTMVDGPNVGDPQVEQITYPVVQTLVGDLYFNNGILVKDC